MTVKDFLILCAQMRKAQNEYFTTRSRRALEEARGLEKRVDEILRARVPEYMNDNKLF